MRETIRDAPLTLQQAAERLGVSVDTVRRRIADGQLRAAKHGRVIRISESEIQRFLRAARTWR
jgi:excisionase family DNA binding protein